VAQSALAAIDGDAILGVLILAGLQIPEHLLRELRKKPSVDDVVLRTSISRLMWRVVADCTFLQF
jgi:hypothetical protein